MRLIDANALMQAIRTDVMGGLNYESFIKEAPTIDAVPRWIPCEERLPEKSGAYLVTIQWKYDPTKRNIMFIRYDEAMGFEEFLSVDVIAWMPLPEPYGGERKNDE